MDRGRGMLAAGFVALLATLALLVVTACSSDPPPPQWQKLTSGSFSGRSERLDLGTVYLITQVRVTWRLSAPSDARAVFRLKTVRISDGGSRPTRPRCAPGRTASLRAPTTPSRSASSSPASLTSRSPSVSLGRCRLRRRFTLYTRDYE